MEMVVPEKHFIPSIEEVEKKIFISGLDAAAIIRDWAEEQSELNGLEVNYVEFVIGTHDEVQRVLIVARPPH